MSTAATSALEAWLARRAKVHQSRIKFRSFEAEPGYEWSEYTAEYFSCKISYEQDGAAKSLYLGEFEVCEFLNEMFASKVVS